MTEEEMLQKLPEHSSVCRHTCSGEGTIRGIVTRQLPFDGDVRTEQHLHSKLPEPASASCCCLVRKYLKNSYTDQAMAVEGI